jgi:Fe-S cluster biogenesis protein NfuA
MTGVAAASGAVSTAALAVRVGRALDDLRPAMVTDGGGVELVGVSDGVVTLRLTGSCLFCPSQALSAQALARRLKERVPELCGVRTL